MLLPMHLPHLFTGIRRPQSNILFHGVPGTGALQSQPCPPHSELSLPGVALFAKHIATSTHINPPSPALCLPCIGTVPLDSMVHVAPSLLRL